MYMYVNIFIHTYQYKYIYTYIYKNPEFVYAKHPDFPATSQSFCEKNIIFLQKFRFSPWISHHFLRESPIFPPKKLVHFFFPFGRLQPARPLSGTIDTGISVVSRE